jgi:hypothetical protein
MKLISYTTKAGTAAENRKKIEAVFSTLHDAKPEGFAYMVVETAAGEFFHLVEATPAALEAFQALPAFRDFSSTVAGRQVEPSTRRDASVVGRYGVLTGK